MKETIKDKNTVEYMLESNHLKYRKITQDDFEELKKMLSDPNVMYAWEHTFSDEQIHDWIQQQFTYYQNDNVGYFAAISKDNGAFIGQIGLHRCEIHHHIHFEVCYMLKHKYWHNGYALEGVRALTDYAFTKMGLNTLYAQIKTNNTASIAVAEQAGFVKETTFSKHYNGTDMEHFLYSKSNRQKQDI